MDFQQNIRMHRRVALSAIVFWMLFVTTLVVVGCDDSHTSDSVQAAQQERILQQATAAVGMPAITHFRERRLLKDILEMRDQDTVTTFTYIYAEGTGKLRFLCDSMGYGLPYATQYTNPQKLEFHTNHGWYNLPQADPNGLFSPADAEGTWVMCKDPNGPDVKPVYIEPKVVTSPFRLPQALLEVPQA